MRNKITTTTLVFLLAVALTAAFAPLTAQPAFPGAGPGFGAEAGHGFAMHGRLAERLELTDEQEETWQAIHEDFRDQARPKMEELRRLGEDLKVALDGEDPQTEEVGALVISMQEIRSELKADRAQLKEDLAAVLTDEQRAEFEEIRERRAERREHRGARRGRPFSRPRR